MSKVLFKSADKMFVARNGPRKDREPTSRYVVKALLIRFTTMKYVKKLKEADIKAGRTGRRSFDVQIDARLMVPVSIYRSGRICSDQLWSHLRAKEELEAKLEEIEERIVGWRALLQAHNEQVDVIQRYSLENGDPIRDTETEVAE